MTSDSTLTTYDEYSINSTGSGTSEIQTTCGTNKTDFTGKGTDSDSTDNAENDREIHRNDNDNAIKDKHNSQDEAYYDGVSYIDYPNDYTYDVYRIKKEVNAYMKKVNDIEDNTYDKEANL